MAPRKRPVAERFFEKLAPQPSGCIHWAGSIAATGYGVMCIDGKSHMAHRVSWELQRGPIPDGLYIDHLCRNRRCVNPDHLEPVTPRENVLRSPIAPPALNARKTTCPRGHELNADNLDSYALRHGRRACSECMRERCRAWHWRNREARLAQMRAYKARRVA